MTDNEVIKALNERTSSGKWIGKGYLDKKDFLLLVNAHNLINRQKAEIERLEKDCKDIDEFARAICEERVLKGKAIADFEDLQSYIKGVIFEARKEFAERLKSKAMQKFDWNEYIEVEDIDNLLEEMESESNAE